MVSDTPVYMYSVMDIRCQSVRTGFFTLKDAATYAQSQSANGNSAFMVIAHFPTGDKNIGMYYSGKWFLSTEFLHRTLQNELEE